MLRAPRLNPRHLRNPKYTWTGRDGHKYMGGVQRLWVLQEDGAMPTTNVHGPITYEVQIPERKASDGSGYVGTPEIIVRAVTGNELRELQNAGVRLDYSVGQYGGGNAHMRLEMPDDDWAFGYLRARAEFDNIQKAKAYALRAFLDVKRKVEGA